MANNTTSETLNTIILKLGAIKRGNSWQARCPAHDDKTPSLSIRQSDEGNICFRCFAGCSTKSIVTALGLEMSDLFAEKKAKPVYEIESVYDYRDESNQLLYQAVRRRLTNPHECPDAKRKAFTQRRPNESGGWIYDLKGVRRVLYRLPELVAAPPDATVFIVEGEKDADRLSKLGLIVTTNPMGAGKWRKDYNEALRGRKVVILPDNDKPGRDHAQDVAKHLHGIAASIRILELPKLPDGGDVSDWLQAGGTVETLRELAEAAPIWTPPTGGDPEETAASINTTTKAGKAIDLALSLAEFFHDDDEESYASVRVNEHRETYSLLSGKFARWLCSIYFTRFAEGLGDQLSQVMATLDAHAQFKGEERNVATRVTEYGGNIYLDLCDKTWRAVEITPDGWRIASSVDLPVRFIRYSGMQALPEPDRDGKITELKDFLNIDDDLSWALTAGWLVMTLHPSGPYPVLSVCGEQGSAKSTFCRVMRSLIDPNKAPLRAKPKEERDLMIAASNSWVVAFDNLSGITRELSDSLCRISTGAGFSTRTLHSNRDETIFALKRPIVLNGIDESAEAVDLHDRAVSVFLKHIPKEKRKPEKVFWANFAQALPRILGGLLAAASQALRDHATTTLESMPRMADFAIWATAAESALGMDKDDFMIAYEGNRKAVDEVALDTSPAMEIRAFVEKLPAPMLPDAPVWEGKASELLKELNQILTEKGEDPRQKREWPKAPNKLTNALRRIAPNLRNVGIEIAIDRPSGKRTIIIKRVSP